jgi:hypothetical protein
MSLRGELVLFVVSLSGLWIGSYHCKGAKMYRSASSSFAALGIALALTFPIPANPQRDNEDATETDAEISSPVEEPRGEAGMLDVASPPSDPAAPLDGRQKDEGPFNPD